MHKNINYQMNIYETERCILRPIQLEDANDMFEYYSKDYVVRYLPIKHHKTILETRRFIKSYFLHSYNIGKISHLAIIFKNNNKVIGNVGFNNISKNSKEGELGICINPEYWGMNLSYELLSTMLIYGFDELHLEKVTAIIYEDNKYSKNIFDKLGFKNVGRLKKLVSYYNHQPVYCYNYEMTRDYYFSRIKK